MCPDARNARRRLIRPFPPALSLLRRRKILLALGPVLLLAATLGPMSASAQPGTCDGVPYLPVGFLPLGVGWAYTVAGGAQNGFVLNGTCYETVGNTLGGVVVDDGVNPMELYGVTDEPALWSLTAGILVEFPLWGTKIHFAGADIKCDPNCGTLKTEFAITDAAMGAYGDGYFAQVPLESPPLWAAAIASCYPCIVTLNAVTEANWLHTLVGGVDPAPYQIPSALMETPLSFSNGPIAGVVLIRQGYPQAFVDVVTNVITTFEISPVYMGWAPAPAGITINPGQPDEEFIPLAAGAHIEAFSPSPGPLTFNFDACYPDIIGENMGWEFAGLQCLGVEIPGGPLAAPPNPMAQTVQRIRPPLDFTKSQGGGAQMAAVDTVDVLGGPILGNGDFQAPGGTPSWDGWTHVDLSTSAPQVGDFAQIRTGLTDIDPCRDNTSPQVAFIDDGVVVPGTGGSVSYYWVYGYGGFSLNCTGGISGNPAASLANEIWSPQIPWPANHRGALLGFDVFCHEPLSPIYSAGMLYVWHVRSSADGGTTWTPWRDRRFGHYGGPQYLRHLEDVTDLIDPAATHVQIALGVQESGALWGANPWQATPGPFFDNVRLQAYERTGPAIHAREMDLAQDAFPADGVLNFTNLANNHVRFDRAASFALPDLGYNLPGDTILAEIAAPGGETLAVAELRYILDPNPLFDPFRTSGLPNQGAVAGVPDVSVPGTENRWAFDLPDIDFLFPGDIIHYYIFAEDSGGLQATLPADLTGYGVFPGDPGYVPLRWSHQFTMRALPTMISADPGDQPQILLWNDSDDQTEMDEWYLALANLGLAEGVDYDLFTTKGAASGVGSGLGRATLDQITWYQTILYTSGDQAKFTLGGVHGGVNYAGDADLLNGWLGTLGGRHLLAMGNHLVSDLNDLGIFYDVLGVGYAGMDVWSLIGGQTSPRVRPIAGNSLGLAGDSYLYGGCDTPCTFDAVEILPWGGGAERLAEFLTYSGAPGAYDYVAGSRTTMFGSEMVYFPFSFKSWYGPSKSPAPLPPRTQALAAVLALFGHAANPGGATETPPPTRIFAARHAPNPFNPLVTISWSLPAPGPLSIRIFDLQGRLVRVLWDEPVVETAGEIAWRGDDQQGHSVASGVYFYKVRSGEKTIVNKIALVR